MYLFLHNKMSRQQQSLRQQQTNKNKRSWNPPNEQDVENTVRATGGGIGEFRSGFFCQSQVANSAYPGWELAFGRIKFPSVEYAANYLKVPWNFSSSSDAALSAHPQILLNFVESTWNLPRPKLLISVTGGATDFPMSGGDKVFFRFFCDGCFSCKL